MSGSFVLGPGESTGGGSRCRAVHVHFAWRCEIVATEATVHTGDHQSTLSDGMVVHWGDLMSERYPGALRDVPEPASNRQVGGGHYKKFKIQPWDVIDEYGLGFYAGNALKYLLRAGHKGSRLEDLKKCRHYLDKLIEVESSEG